MKKIKFTGERNDPFSHSARWDSVGIDCSLCIHIKSNGNWPNRDKIYSCNLHKISLALQIEKNGYKNGEWFCSDFKDNGNSNVKSVEEFSIQVFKNKTLHYIGSIGEPILTIEMDKIN